MFVETPISSDSNKLLGSFEISFEVFPVTYSSTHRLTKKNVLILEYGQQHLSSSKWLIKITKPLMLQKHLHMPYLKSGEDPRPKGPLPRGRGGIDSDMCGSILLVHW